MIRTKLLSCLLAIAVTGCGSLFADIPRIGYELTRTFGEPPLVHRNSNGSLEVIFPESLVEGQDSAARHDLAWRIARETRTHVSAPESVPYVQVAFRARQQRRQRTPAREEGYVWAMPAIGEGNAAAVSAPRRTPVGAPEMGSMDTDWSPEPPMGRARQRGM